MESYNRKMKKITYNVVFDILIDKMLHDQSLDVVSGWRFMKLTRSLLLMLSEKNWPFLNNIEMPAVGRFFFQKAVEYHNSHYELCRQYLLLLKLAYCKHLL